MTDAPAGWRQATPDDIGPINRIEARVHTFAPERPAVWAERLTLFPGGVRMLLHGDVTLGYAAAYPWRLGEVPALDTLMGALPTDADCLYVHDVALLPEARGRGHGGAYVAHVAGLARDLGMTHLALVSVYGTTTVWARCGFRLRLAEDPRAMTMYGDTARYMVADVSEVVDRRTV